MGGLRLTSPHPGSTAAVGWAAGADLGGLVAVAAGSGIMVLVAVGVAVAVGALAAVAGSIGALPETAVGEGMLSGISNSDRAASSLAGETIVGNTPPIGVGLRKMLMKGN